MEKELQKISVVSLLLNTKLYMYKVKVHETRQTIQELYAKVLRAHAGLRDTFIGDSKEVTL